MGISNYTSKVPNFGIPVKITLDEAFNVSRFTQDLRGHFKVISLVDIISWPSQ